MKKFKVSVYREWLERGTVDVVAADSDEAMQFARELLDMDDPDIFWVSENMDITSQGTEGVGELDS